MKPRLTIIALILIAFASGSAHSATMKLYYNVDGLRGWKGGYQTLADCHEGAKRNRYTPTQYYCSTAPDLALERRLGWRN